MSAYRISNDKGERIGTVAKYAGEPPATRWWAFSIHRRDPINEHKAGFRTRKEAVAWLLEQRPAEEPGR